VHSKQLSIVTAEWVGTLCNSAVGEQLAASWHGGSLSIFIRLLHPGPFPDWQLSS